MKVIIAVLAAAGVFGGSYLVYQVGSLEQKVSQLESDLADARRAEPAPEVKDDSETDQRVADLETRLAAVEDASRSGQSTPTLADAASSLPKALALISKNKESIDEIRELVSKVGQTNKLIDDTAERFLGAVASGNSDGEGSSRRRGLADLLEAGSLMSKKREDLTEDELAKRDSLEAQFRDRRIDWTIRGYDRALSTKLTDDQKQSIGTLLAEENTALSELRSQDLSEEDRDAEKKRIRANTDDQVSRLVDADQHEAWKKQRSRSRRLFR